MTGVSRSVASLRITGDGLVPSEVSQKLGCNATHEILKGEVLVGKVTGRKRIAKFGMWKFQFSEQLPECIDLHIEEITKITTPDLDVWDSLSQEHHIDLFCGLFMTHSNEVMDLSPHSLKILGERGIQLSLDIYGGSEVNQE